ncbi:MAG: hypothetical protein JNK21_10700 [Rhodospirillaceae bacterium]|nr:hypothetical protein [Rhodospirillaceae bacterium]
MFDITTLTGFHTIMSIIAILVGIPALMELFKGRVNSPISTAFLVLAIGTSVTGYFFPFVGVTPAQIVGAIALIILAVMLLARFKYGLSGAWRWIYAAGMVVSEYLLVFVAVVQAFNKVGALAALAPTQSEPPFAISQLIVLAAFAFIGFKAAKAFKPT